jgi:hypothetical protein
LHFDSKDTFRASHPVSPHFQCLAAILNFQVNWNKTDVQVNATVLMPHLDAMPGRHLAVVSLIPGTVTIRDCRCDPQIASLPPTFYTNYCSDEGDATKRGSEG